MVIAVIVASLVFGAGVALIVYSVEALTDNLVRASLATGVSPFMLAILFVGMDFENWAFGIASMLEGAHGLAIGSALGSGCFLVGVALPLGGFLVPFRVRVRRDYLLLLGLAPWPLAFLLWDGVVSRLDGVLLMGSFALLIAYIYRGESRGSATFRDEETREAQEEGHGEESGAHYPLVLSLLCVVGIVTGSELAVRGARHLVFQLGLNETAFGMTVVGVAMGAEEISLVLVPVREDRVSIALGNLIGSLVFFATGNVGLLALTRPLILDPSVLRLHGPAFLLAVGLVILLALRGRVMRAEATVLAVLYGLYWFWSYSLV